MKRYRQIHYKKNNIKNQRTFSSNIVNLLSMIDTEYIWLFGDDDVIKKGAIKIVMKELKSNDFLLVNSEVWDSSMYKIVQERRLPIYKDVIYSNGDHNQVLADAENGYAGFIGTIITRGIYIAKELKKLKNRNFYWGDFLHIPILFRSIVDKRGKFIADPLIRYRSAKKTNFVGKEFELVVLEFPNALKMLRPYYSREVIASHSKISIYRAVAISCVSKLRYPEKSRIYAKMVMRSDSLSLIHKSIMLSILNAPNILVKLVCLSYAKLVSKNLPLG